VTPSVTPTPTPTATPLPGSCRELLINGSFEEGRGWTFPLTAFSAAYSTERALAGSSSLQLGIPGDVANRYAYSTAYQTVRLPATASQITLQAQVWRSSPGPATEKDLHYLWVTIVGGRIYQVFQSRTHAENWELITYDLTPFKGRSVQILFGVYNNGIRERTLMYVDEASIQSCE
jgi:hypothetical protein